MSLVGQHLHFDCASGIAGDMTLAAMLDLGVPRDVIEAAFVAVGIGKERLSAVRVTKHGMAAMQVDIDVDTPLGQGWALVGGAAAATSPARVAHASAQQGHEHHAYGAIRLRVETSTLAPDAKQRAIDIFDRIARAEAKLHGTTVEAVAFHEVGAIDSIADVVGAAAALAYLAPASVSCASVAMGHGEIRCAHGVLPVPAPAALEILRECRGVMADGGVARELCTPTGAAILAHAVTQWGPSPTVQPVAVGWGAGHANLVDRANVVRLVVGQRVATSAAAGAGEIWQLECNLDDMNPEWLPSIVAHTLVIGALDAWTTAVAMKKGRSGVVLSALVPDALMSTITQYWLHETTTLGVRQWPVSRTVMQRKHVTVQTPWGAVRVKVAMQDGVAIKAAPEHDDCAAVAAQAAVPLKQVYEAAMAAYVTAS